MRGTLSARTLATSALVTCCLAPTLAQADVHLAFGTKWQPLRYTTAAYPNAGGPAPVSLSGFQSTSLDPYLAIFFAQKYGLSLALDIGYGKLARETQTGMAVPAPSNDSYFQFGFGLGFKWYITQPRTNKVSPLLYADIFKYFASVTTDKMSVTGDQAAAQAALLAPFGGTISFGAEYFVSPNFSIGSEVFGLKIAGVTSDLNTGTPPNNTRITQNYTYVTFYTGITLNYRFQVQASVQSNDEDDKEETPAPKKKKKAPTTPEGEDDGNTASKPQPPPPPPSPEAVD